MNFEGNTTFQHNATDINGEEYIRTRALTYMMYKVGKSVTTKGIITLLLKFKGQAEIRNNLVK